MEPSVYGQTVPVPALLPNGKARALAAGGEGAVPSYFAELANGYSGGAQEAWQFTDLATLSQYAATRSPLVVDVFPGNFTGTLNVGAGNQLVLQGRSSAVSGGGEAPNTQLATVVLGTGASLTMNNGVGATSLTTNASCVVNLFGAFVGSLSLGSSSTLNCGGTSVVPVLACASSSTSSLFDAVVSTLGMNGPAVQVTTYGGEISAVTMAPSSSSAQTLNGIGTDFHSGISATGISTARAQINLVSCAADVTLNGYCTLQAQGGAVTATGTSTDTYDPAVLNFGALTNGANTFAIPMSNANYTVLAELEGKGATGLQGVPIISSKTSTGFTATFPPDDTYAYSALVFRTDAAPF